MNNWPHDDNASLIAYYGDPESRLFPMKLVRCIPPWQMMYKDDDFKISPVKSFIIHERCLSSINQIFAELRGIYDTQDKINAVGLQWFGGCYNPRPVRGSTTKLSTHAFAAGIDLDPEHEPMNRVHKSNMAQPIVDAFKRSDWFWGGDFVHRQDPMHFQAAREGEL